MDQEKFLLLRSLQLFDPLSNYSLKAILSSTHFLKTKRNQIIFFEGDETKSIYIVKSGKFKVRLKLLFLKKEKRNYFII